MIFLHVKEYIGNNVDNMWACMSICKTKEQHFKGFLNQFSVVQIFKEHGLNHRMQIYQQLFFLTSLKNHHPGFFFFIAFTDDHKRKTPPALLTALWSFLHLFPPSTLLHFPVSPLSFFSSLFYKPPSTNRIQLFFCPKSIAETLTSK